MPNYRLTAAGPVIIDDHGRIFLVKKANEPGWGFSGGKVPEEVQHSYNLDLLEALAMVLHLKNTGTDLRLLGERLAYFEYVEKSKSVRLVHFIYLVKADFLDTWHKPAKHRKFKFFTMAELRQLAETDKLLPNVMKVVSFLQAKNLI
jgi:ADP-ribose pyrophosphatase YjhB (NUDIX family)